MSRSGRSTPGACPDPCRPRAQRCTLLSTVDRSIFELAVLTNQPVGGALHEPSPVLEVVGDRRRDRPGRRGRDVRHGHRVHRPPEGPVVGAAGRGGALVAVAEPVPSGIEVPRQQGVVVRDSACAQLLGRLGDPADGRGLLRPVVGSARCRFGRRCSVSAAVRCVDGRRGPRGQDQALGDAVASRRRARGRHRTGCRALRRRCRCVAPVAWRRPIATSSPDGHERLSTSEDRTPPTGPSRSVIARRAHRARRPRRGAAGSGRGTRLSGSRIRTGSRPTGVGSRHRAVARLGAGAASRRATSCHARPVLRRVGEHRA